MTSTTHSTTRRFPHRTRALWAVLVAAALVVAGVGLTARATDGTSAAWTNDVHTTTDVTLGTWVDGFGTCVVRNVADDAIVPGVPCKITDIKEQNVWGFPGGMTLQGHAYFEAPGIAYGHYIAFDFTIPPPSDSRWSWANASVVSANNTAAIYSGCDELPRVVGRLAPNIGAVPEVFLVLHDTRVEDALCQ